MWQVRCHATCIIFVMQVSFRVIRFFEMLAAGFICALSLCGSTIVSVTGTAANSALLGTSSVTDIQQALAFGWSQTGTYSDVAISALLETATFSGTAYLTDSLGACRK